MKRAIVIAVLAVACFAANAQAQFYAVDSSDHVGALTTNAIGSAQAAPLWVHVTPTMGSYFARIGVPLLIVLRDSTGDSSFYQKFELDSVTQIVSDSLYVVKRALSNSSKYYWAPGTEVDAVDNDGIIIDQLQDKLESLIGLPDTTNHAGQWLYDSAGGVGPIWKSLSTGGGDVTSFNTRTGDVVPGSGDYNFNQLNGVAAVPQGGTALTTIAANKLIYGKALNVYAPLSIGAGLSITSDTLNVSGFEPSLPDTTGLTNDALTVKPDGSIGWSGVGTGTVTSVNVSGGMSGLIFGNGPVVKTGTIPITGGQLAVSYGGTGGATPQQALNNLLPDTTGKTNKYLRVNSGGGVVWDTAVGSGGSGTGTIDSVNITIGGMKSNGPLTGSGGTINMGGALSDTSGGTGLQTPPTNGQVLIGKTSTGTYVLNTITGTSNEVTVTPGAGTITLSTPQPIAPTSDVTFDSLKLTKPLPVISGGTGFATTTAHGILIGEATATLSNLGSATNGQIPIGSTGADPVLATITGTTGEVNVGNGAGTITLSTPQAIATTSSPTFNAVTLTTPLTVPNGGLGAATLSGILKGNGTSAVTAISIPSDATKYLDGTGAFSTPAGSSTANIAGGTAGAIPYQSAANTTAVLAATATAKQALLSGASATPSWSTATYPATTTANNLLYSSATNTIASLATANSGVLATNGSGVPSITSTPQLGVVSTSTGSIAFANSGSANLATLTSASQAGANTYTIPDAGASASFVMTEGGQTIAGGKTFSNAVIVNNNINVNSGDISVAGGGLALTTAGKGISITGGTNAKIGTATLSSGTVTVSTTAVTAQSLIFLTDQTTGANLGTLSIGTINVGTSFVINSSNALDANTVAWMIVEKL